MKEIDLVETMIMIVSLVEAPRQPDLKRYSR